MTTFSITATPANAQCRSMLPDGRVLTITASRRPRANRAEVKCDVPGSSSCAARMQEAVRLARHTEVRFDSRDQVVLSMDLAPQAGERNWELAAVLADRMVRGVYQPPVGAQVFARGWSDTWHLGQVNDGALAMDGDGVSTSITHLGALSGHADPSSAVSTVRAWFPLYSGGVHDTLAWVEVSVFPIERQGDDDGGNAAIEDTIAAPGLDLAAQQQVRQTVAGARHFDGKGHGQLRTVVRFDQPRFQGTSYQLALVMADRLARGREFVPRGRIIATGCSSAWHAGRVETVEGHEAKLALILRQACDGDRVLLPKDWMELLPAGFGAELRRKGASVACIERIGMI